MTFKERIPSQRESVFYIHVSQFGVGPGVLAAMPNIRDCKDLLLEKCIWWGVCLLSFFFNLVLGDLHWTQK